MPDDGEVACVGVGFNGGEGGGHCLAQVGNVPSTESVSDAHRDEGVAHVGEKRVDPKENVSEDVRRDDAGGDVSESLDAHPSVVLQPSFVVRPFSTTLNFLSVFSTPIGSSPSMKPPHASAWDAMAAVLKHTKPRPKNCPSFGSCSQWMLRIPSAPKVSYCFRTTSSVSL